MNIIPTFKQIESLIDEIMPDDDNLAEFYKEEFQKFITYSKNSKYNIPKALKDEIKLRNDIERIASKAILESCMKAIIDANDEFVSKIKRREV